MPLRCTRPRLPRQWFAPLVLSLLVTFGLLAPTAMAQSAARQSRAVTSAVIVVSSPSPELESQFVSRINSLRASKGLSQLQVSGELTGVARNWTEQMVANGQISHNPNLGSQVSGDWTKLGENVGVGYDVDGLMQAFINSPAHYRNLVDPDWNYVGVGVTMAPDGRMYTTHNFMARGASAPPPPPPPPPPATSPTPRQATSPTTRSPASSSRPASSSPPTAAQTTTTTTTAPPPPQPHPTSERVSAVLDPLRSIEHG